MGSVSMRGTVSPSEQATDIQIVKDANRESGKNVFLALPRVAGGIAGGLVGLADKALGGEDPVHTAGTVGELAGGSVGLTEIIASGIIVGWGLAEVAGVSELAGMIAGGTGSFLSAALDPKDTVFSCIDEGGYAGEGVARFLGLG